MIDTKRTDTPASVLDAVKAAVDRGDVQGLYDCIKAFAQDIAKLERELSAEREKVRELVSVIDGLLNPGFGGRHRFEQRAANLVAKHKEPK